MKNLFNLKLLKKYFKCHSYDNKNLKVKRNTKLETLNSK